MFDNFNKKIIEIIQKNGKVSYEKIGNEVGLSTSAVNERLKKMLSGGIIKRYVALIDPGSIGLDICAFVQVLIEAPETEDNFIKKISRIDEIQECHCITGEYSYLLKVRTKNTIEFEGLLREKIKSIKGVVRTNSIITLTSPKEEVKLPVPDVQRNNKT